MHQAAQSTLLHPLRSGEVALPSRGGRVICLGAQPGFRLPEEITPEVLLVQGFRPHFLALMADGHQVAATPRGTDYDAGLVVAGRHKGFNELLIAECLERISDGGLAVVAGSKRDGIAGLLRTVKGSLALEGSLSKFHGTAFWFRRSARSLALAAELRERNPGRLVEGQFRTGPGMFSADEIDPGSRLLGDYLDPETSGAVADFCAGWGYLASVAVNRCPAIARLDLYEADFASLEAARQNLAETAAGGTVDFYWQDLASEPVAISYDTILMNPPFHAGREADPALGQGLIRAAAAALRPGGRMLLVANRQLPYEKTIAACFSRHMKLCEREGYKVIEARR